MSTFETVLNLTGFKKPRKDTVEREKLGKVLEAGRNTPSPGNVQTLEFIVIESGEQLEIVSKILGDNRIEDAPATIAVVSDLERMERRLGKPPREFCTAESAAAVQNMRLVAEEEGLSSVWKTGFDTEAVSEQLDVPDGKEVMATVTLAYTDNPVHSDPRFGMNQVAFYDKYGHQVGSFFDSMHWKGLKEEKRIFGKKKRGVISRLRKKLEEVL